MKQHFHTLAGMIAVAVALWCAQVDAQIVSRVVSPDVGEQEVEIIEFDDNTSGAEGATTVPLFAGIANMSPAEIDELLAGKSREELVAAARRLDGERLSKDACVLYEEVVTDTDTDEALCALAVGYYVNALRNSNQHAKIEPEMEEIVELWSDSLAVVLAAVRGLQSAPQDAFLVDGELVFQRTPGAEYVSLHERRRVRTLQILRDALPLARQATASGIVAQFYQTFIQTLQNNDGGYWKLQTLTNLDELPEIKDVADNDDYLYDGSRHEGAPVDENGNPVFFMTPDSFESAQNDGERVQALRAEAFEKSDKRGRYNALMSRANEARANFGVETLARYQAFQDFLYNNSDTTAGVWSLHTLKDAETIAKLATGVKRFTLPPEYDYIAAWREALEYAETENEYAEPLRALATELQNRRQLDRAAECWSQLIAKLETFSNPNPNLLESAKGALSQIVDPKLQIDQSASQVNGVKAQLAIKFRNAKRVELVVKELKVDELVKQLTQPEFIKENRNTDVSRRVADLLQADYIEPNEVNATLLQRLRPLKSKFVGEEVARTAQSLEPDPNHYDRQAELELPELPPGAYLVEARAQDGNIDYAVIWLRDRIVMRTTYDAGHCFLLVDSETGAPVANALMELIFVTRYWDRNAKNAIEVHKKMARTDSQGAVLVANSEIPQNGSSSTEVVAIAPSANPQRPQQYTFLNSGTIYRVSRNDDSYFRRSGYFVSDRPIYRPNQRAEFKFWVGTASYDGMNEQSAWAGQKVAYLIYSPNGEIVARKNEITLDEYGAFSDSFDIPADAQLGVYSITLCSRFNNDGNPVDHLGGGNFRLEEYRKPEFKVVVDAPKDPVKLGEKFKATVRANYYFGAPVAKGTVSYTVTRTTHRSSYYPARYWDWFYGSGYWQFTYDCFWYPGAYKWCCRRLPPFYVGFSFMPPEEIASGEAPIKEDGTFEIEIDSSLAKEIYPNDDHCYEITATVVDESRRSIFGSGKVYATREPFQTYAWFDRGFYKVGDTMSASFQGRRLDGKPVLGEATVTLYKITYAKTNDDAIKPTETEVFSTTLATDERGCGSVDMTASEPGQYRLSCRLRTESGIEEEGGQLIMVRGTEAAVARRSQPRGDYRFSALEIIPEKPEYAVGDLAKIQIASNRADAVVFVKIRTENDGLGEGKPIMLQLKNGVAELPVKILNRDQPNFFVEASTVFEGRFYDETKEIAVPPAERTLDIAVEPSKERVKPGEKAKIKLRLTDPNGEPVVGQTVATIYDKSLDDLVGGVANQDIREFFWKWRRYCNGSTFSSNASAGTLFDAWGYVTIGKKWTPFERGMQRLATIGLFNESMNNVVFSKARTLDAVGGMGGKGTVLSRASIPVSGLNRAMALADDADMEMAVAEESAADMDMGGGMRMEAKAVAAAPAMAPAAGELPAPMEAESVNFVEATVRKNLADLAYWAVDLKPDDDGVIEIEVDMPENLTTWKIAAWSVGAGLRVGSGESEIITTKDLIIRMQKPRFLTQKDEVTLSANVHNYLDSEKQVRVSLETPQDDPENSTGAIAFLNNDAQVDVNVPANGEARVDWRVRAEKHGVVTLLMKALTNEESDAIQDVIKIKEHGIDKQVAVSGVIPQPESKDEKTREASFKMIVPEERRPETTKLTVRFSPTLAGAIFDALPYMMEYPYGCTEQTLNKFLPLVIAQKALLDSGVDLEALQNKKANLNAQELGDAQERAQRWGSKRNPLANPVFDPGEARQRVAVGVERLTSMQNPDGGWGWFYGAGCTSSARQTALIARGLQLAQDCDFAVEPYVIDRGRDFLIQYEREQAIKLIRGKYWSDEKKREEGAYRLYREGVSSEDVFVYFALAELGVQPVAYDKGLIDVANAKLSDERAATPEAVHAVMKEFIWNARANLQLYPLATFGLTLARETEKFESTPARLEMILRVLEQYRVVDPENQTVWLDLNRVNGWYFWSWFGSEFETQAYYLRLLNNVDPAILKKVGVDKDAPMLVKYLLNNRKHATYWNSTRDTAICVEAFVEYMRGANELAPNATVEILLDGELQKKVEYTPENLFETDGTLEIPAEALDAGEHTISVRVDGDCPIYYNAYLQYFTLEDPITKAGLEVKVDRKYYKLVKNDAATAIVEGGRGQAIEQRVVEYERQPLNDGDDVTSGELIEVELIVDSKNDYESILLEEPKAAGMETVDQQSGYKWDGLPAYVEYRDDRVCFFVENLPQGRSITKYRLRAETPGKFAALPATIYGMYAPELKGNSDEFKTQISDKSN